MGLGSWWVEWVERRRVRRGRVRGTWRRCQRCGSYSYQTDNSGLCGGCLIVQ